MLILLSIAVWQSNPQMLVMMMLMLLLIQYDIFILKPGVANL